MDNEGTLFLHPDLVKTVMWLRTAPRPAALADVERATGVRLTRTLLAQGEHAGVVRYVNLGKGREGFV